MSETKEERREWGGRKGRDEGKKVRNGEEGKEEGRR